MRAAGRGGHGISWGVLLQTDIQTDSDYEGDGGETYLGDGGHGKLHGQVVRRVHELLGLILKGILLLRSRAAVLSHEGVHGGGFCV